MEDTGETGWSSRGRLLPLGVCCLLVAVPFLSVQLPPVTDLPQHLAQIRLLHEALADPDGPYRIQWLTPYLLGYLPLTLAWKLSPGEGAARTAMLIVALLWILAIHWLAFKRGRAASAAILASALFFNHDTYWGFYSFVTGWPVFVLWFLLTTRVADDRFRPIDVPLYLGAAWLLYMSHALWFAAGLAWLLLWSAVTKQSLRTTGLRLASLSPVLVLAALWYPRMSAAGFSSPTRWDIVPSARLSFWWIVDAAFGGLRGPLEYVMVAVLAGWVTLGLYQNRERLGACVDRGLCLAGVFFLGLALVLPDWHQSTIAFASRWFPVATIMLLLALPTPVWDRTLRTATATAVLALFVVATSLTWIRFERSEWDGLPESLEALPANARVIGLDYVKTSTIVKGRPFLQAFAYAQVLRGGRLNFSFAELAPMAVVYKAPRSSRPWTRGIEWVAERAKRSDLRYFDYAIVNGDASQHAAVAALAELTPVTADGAWRLYRVRVTDQ